MSALEQHYSPEDVAEKLGVHIDTVYRLCRENKLPSSRVGRRRVIPESGIEQLLQGKEVRLAEVLEFRKAQ